MFRVTFLKIFDHAIPLYISYLHENSANDVLVLMCLYTIDHSTSNNSQNALISCDLADSYWFDKCLYRIDKRIQSD